MNDLQGELALEIKRCTELFNSQIFINYSVFTQSAFIEILIRLDYVLQKLSKQGNRINWTNDIQINQDVADVTDLVSNLRNAACHNESFLNYISNSNIKFVFNSFNGKCPNAIQIGQNQKLGCEYEDDIAFYYGDKRIYLIRHIKRLLEDLPPYIKDLKSKIQTD